jgi:cold shock CspA family protein
MSSVETTSTVHDNVEQNETEEVTNENLSYNESTVYTGQCKWFSNKLGYGYITSVSENLKGKDFFVHFSDIKPLSSPFKTLTNGEYINFNLKSNDKGPQATNIKGVQGGPLMCDLHHEKKQKSSNEENEEHLYPNNTTENNLNERKKGKTFQKHKNRHWKNNSRNAQFDNTVVPVYMNESGMFFAPASQVNSFTQNQNQNQNYTKRNNSQFKNNMNESAE